MPRKYMEADVIKDTSHHDVSGMFAMKNRADAQNYYNNYIHYHSFYELEFIISGCGTSPREYRANYLKMISSE